MVSSSSSSLRRLFLCVYNHLVIILKFLFVHTSLTYIYNIIITTNLNCTDMFGDIANLLLVSMDNNDFALVTERNRVEMIFLLLNHLSHDTHFSKRKNMDIFQGLKKFKIFSLHRFSWYSIPNMALQKIILTSFFDICFSFSRSRAMRFPWHNFSKILSNPKNFRRHAQGWQDTFRAISNQRFRR